MAQFHDALRLTWSPGAFTIEMGRRGTEGGHYGRILGINERSTKTRQGTTRNNVRPFHPKMFATGSFILSQFSYVTLNLGCLN
jgi:hypothetical protein